MRPTDLLLSFIAPAILVLLAIIFLRRRLYRELPFFFIYIVYAPLATLRILTGSRPVLHFWLYWITEALYGILALLVLREVFHRVFAMSYAAYRWFRFLLPVALLLILGMSLAEAFIHPFGGGYIPRFITAVYWFDLGVHALEGTILLLVGTLTMAFPVRWRQYEFGILTGFGISACVIMLADLLALQTGVTYEAFFRYGPPIAYVAATLIWLEAFVRPPKTWVRPQMDLDEWLAVVRRSRRAWERMGRALGLRRRVLLPPV